MKTVKENQANTAKTEGKWLRDSETKFHDLPLYRQVRRLIYAFQDRGISLKMHEACSILNVEVKDL